MNRLCVVIKNTAIQVIGKVVTAGSTLLIIQLSSRYLGLEGFGEYSIILAYSAYFYILTDFGLNAIATKRITQNESETENYFSSLLSLRLIGSIGLIIVALSILAFLPYSTQIKIGILFSLLTVIAQAIFVNCNMLFQAKLRYDQAVIASVLGSLVSLSLAYLSFQLGGGLYSLVLSVVFGYLVMALCALIFARAYAPIRLKVNLPLWRDVFISALPLSLTIIFNLTYFKADSFILSVSPLKPHLGLTNEQATGLYSMAYKIFEVILVLPVFFVNVLYPLMVKAHLSSFESFKQMVKRALLALFGLSLIAVVLMYSSSPFLIMIASGGNPEFNPSVKVLQILSLSLPLFFLTNTLLWSIMTLGKQKVLAFFYATSAIINVGLNVWLIPQYGYIAAALTTGVTEAVTLVLLGTTVWLYLKNEKAT